MKVVWLWRLYTILVTPLCQRYFKTARSVFQINTFRCNMAMNNNQTRHWLLILAMGSIEIDDWQYSSRHNQLEASSSWQLPWINWGYLNFKFKFLSLMNRRPSSVSWRLNLERIVKSRSLLKLNLLSKPSP